MALSRNGRALTHVASELRADKEVVMAAVNRSGTALEFAASGEPAQSRLYVG